MRLPAQIVDVVDPTRAREERALLRRLRDAKDLDGLLQRLGVRHVVGALRDRGRRRHRSDLIELLARERVDELSGRTIATIVRALQGPVMPASHRHGIRDMLLAVDGERLLEAKYAIGSGGDHHDLEHLVFQQLDAESRAAVLAHIIDESAAHPSSELRILCDIDDTVRAMLHERRWPRGTIYPGVAELLSALDRGAAASPGRPGDLTFVTARPGGPFGLIEQYTLGGLESLDLPPHSVLGGSFLNVFTKRSIAARKMQNFEHEQQLFPECRRVFIGDSGQADPEVGAQMLARDPDLMAAVLIHDVTGIDDEARASLAARGIHVFDTYAGAAAHLFAAGLIAREGLDAVVDAVRAGLAGARMASETRIALEQTLERDVAGL